MRFDADIRLLVRVPFDVDVDELAGPPARPTGDDVDQRALNRYDRALAAHHEAIDRVSEQRVEAARHAEEQLVEQLRAALAGQADIVEVTVEEVREA